MPAPPKQVRFDDLVKASGSPEQVTLWAAPDPSSEFMNAVGQNRVATIVQHNTGTKKDYGVIGFETLPNATFLLFPKPLPYAAGVKIVGIKYEQLAQSEPKGPLYSPARPKPKPTAPTKETAVRAETPRQTQKVRAEPRGKAPPPPPAPPAPKPKVVHRFRAAVELVARQTVELEVSAESAPEAANLLRAQAQSLRLSENAAELQRRVSKPRKVS